MTSVSSAQAGIVLYTCVKKGRSIPVACKGKEKEPACDMGGYFAVWLIFLVMSAVVLWGWKQAKTIIKDIHCLGQDTFKIVREKVISTDPLKLKNRADIILITHEYHDHYCPDAVKMR